MRTTTAALLVALAAGAAGAQDAPEEGKEPASVLLPVGDLVRSVPPRPVPRPVSTLPFAPLPPLVGVNFGIPEAGDPGNEPLLGEGEVLSTVETLLGGSPLRSGGMVPGDLLQVPAADAAAVRAALDRIRGVRVPTITVAYSLEVAQAGAWKTLLSGEEPVRPGVGAVFAEAEDSTFLADYDVELAQDSQLPDPIVMTRRTGASLGLRVSCLPGGRSAVVEAEARCSTLLPKETAETRYPEMAPLDRGAVRAGQTALIFRAEPGKETVHGWTGRDGRFFRLRLTSSWTPPARAPDPVALLWSPAFDLIPHHRRRYGHDLRPAGAEADEINPRFGAIEEAARIGPEDRLLAFRAGMPAAMEFTDERCGTSLLLLTGPGAPAAAGALEGVMDGEFANALVEVEAREGGDEGRVLFAATGPLSAGYDVNFHSGEARLFIEDWDVEVAQGSWIPDPIVDCLQTGDYLNLRLVGGGEGGVDAVDVDLGMSLFAGFATEDLPVLDAMDRTGGSPSGAPTGSPKGASYRIEKPTVRAVRIAGRYPLAADGTVTIRRSAERLLGEGKGIVLTVRVKKP